MFQKCQVTLFHVIIQWDWRFPKISTPVTSGTLFWYAEDDYSSLNVSLLYLYFLFRRCFYLKHLVPGVECLVQVHIDLCLWTAWSKRSQGIEFLYSLCERLWKCPSVHYTVLIPEQVFVFSHYDDYLNLSKRLLLCIPQ